MERGSIIYSEGVTVDYDGFKALNNLNFIVTTGAAGGDRSERRRQDDTARRDLRKDQAGWRGGSSSARILDLIGLREDEIATLGIGRKFQAPSIYANLTVWENLDLSLRRPSKGVVATLLGARRRRSGRQIARLSRTIGLKDSALVRAGSLSHGKSSGSKSAW